LLDTHDGKKKNSDEINNDLLTILNKYKKNSSGIIFYLITKVKNFKVSNSRIIRIMILVTVKYLSEIDISFSSVIIFYSEYSHFI